MEKISKKFKELNEIQKLKIRKVFMYREIEIEKVNESTIIFEGDSMKYVVVDEEIIDLY